MAQLGMDVEAVESVGRQLKQSATSVDQIVGGLDKTVNGLLQLWEGPDAQRFVQSWPTFRKSLIAAQASVAGLGQSALNNASEQRDASGVKGSNGSSSVTLPSAIHVDTPAPPPSLPGATGATTGALPAGAGLEGYAQRVGKTNDDHLDGMGALAGECTSWAAYRRIELGLPVPAGGTGYGFEMAGKLSGSADFAPSLGAIVSEPHPHNHVMIVEEISDGGKTIRVSEMHVPVPGGSTPVLGNVRTDRTWTQQVNGTWIAHPNWDGSVPLVFSPPATSK